MKGDIEIGKKILEKMNMDIENWKNVLEEKKVEKDDLIKKVEELRKERRKEKENKIIEKSIEIIVLEKIEEILREEVWSNDDESIEEIKSEEMEVSKE